MLLKFATRHDSKHSLHSSDVRHDDHSALPVCEPASTVLEAQVRFSLPAILQWQVVQVDLHQK